MNVHKTPVHVSCTWQFCMIIQDIDNYLPSILLLPFWEISVDSEITVF